MAADPKQDMSNFAPAALSSLDNPKAFRHMEMLIDKNWIDKARYTKYALNCHSREIGISSGKEQGARPGQATPNWPVMPHEALIVTTDNGYDYAEPGMDGPRLLNEVDPVNFILLEPPADHSVSEIERRAALPPGVIDIGAVQGNPESGIYSVGPNDTWPAGVPTPPAADGHRYVKFSWANLGYKYERY